MNHLRNHNASLDSLAAAYMAAKAKEDAARAERIQAETDLLDTLGAPEEGSKKYDGGDHRVTISGRIARTVQLEHIEKIQAILPPVVFKSVIKPKPSLDVRAYKALADADPDMFMRLCQYIDSKPGKPGVKVEALA